MREGKMTAMGDKTYATSNVRELFSRTAEDGVLLYPSRSRLVRLR
ncbi:hypothetical protein [Salinivibrio proteolyticus]|uniref:Transposase DDE domain-containing protein n=1 Tax=Salinivibrio proteolyticus TaxID=334715 RepID=A0ABY7LHQ9_9GAMM|nr:hypothetical protein [Salinivibrio proteolyticus]WBA16716.1 hypothetical protein N7E60_15180 [Salinivibrio proteolyticus]